ncbi:hypothetical protein KEJ34_05790 [Candidatus Bathyarchaeota archaeon]|nr:hypothetical protein [Candidatus Bathyarchaeota archaeon]
MHECSVVTIKIDEPISPIDPNIFGHFIEHLGRCIYPGIRVGKGSSIPNEDGLRLTLRPKGTP